MIVVFTGLPGAGKTHRMAETIIKVLDRNKKWKEKSDILRPVYSNIKLSAEVEAEYKGFIHYWSEPAELVSLRDVDVFWDEIATHLDSTQWQNMSLEIKRWLQQHRKFGIEIYGTTQDFAMIDKSMRRLTSDLFIIRKLIGSPDKSSTRPPVKLIWGVSSVQGMDPTAYDEESSKQKAGFPSFMFFSRDSVGIFDTTQEIKMGKYPPLNHIERECIFEGCRFHRITHA